MTTFLVKEMMLSSREKEGGRGKEIQQRILCKEKSNTLSKFDVSKSYFTQDSDI